MPQRRRRIFGLAAKMVFNLPKHMLYIYFAVVSLCWALAAAVYTIGQEKLATQTWVKFPLSNSRRIIIHIGNFRHHAHRGANVAASDFKLFVSALSACRTFIIMCFLWMDFLWQQSAWIYIKSMKLRANTQRRIINRCASESENKTPRCFLAYFYSFYSEEVSFSSPSVFMALCTLCTPYFMTGRLLYVLRAPPFLLSQSATFIYYECSPRELEGGEFKACSSRFVLNVQTSAKNWRRTPSI